MSTSCTRFTPGGLLSRHYGKTKISLIRTPNLGLRFPVNNANGNAFNIRVELFVVIVLKKNLN